MNTRPSYAAILHRLALGETVDGAELLELPGADQVDANFPILGSIAGYRLDDLPELLLHVCRLAQPVDTHLALFGCNLVRLIQSGAPMPFTLPPDARAAAFELGAAADLAVGLGLSPKEPKPCQVAST